MRDDRRAGQLLGEKTGPVLGENQQACHRLSPTRSFTELALHFLVVTATAEMEREEARYEGWCEARARLVYNPPKDAASRAEMDSFILDDFGPC